MCAGPRVFRGVLIRRTVAAQGNTAGLAGSQMHPGRADLDALLAFEAFRQSHFADGLNVTTFSRTHDPSFIASCTPAMAMLPSPTAAAQRLTEPERTSPTANT